MTDSIPGNERDLERQRDREFAADTSDKHGWSCECRVCLGGDFDRYHAMVARSEDDF